MFNIILDIYIIYELHTLKIFNYYHRNMLEYNKFTYRNKVKDS